MRFKLKIVLNMIRMALFHRFKTRVQLDRFQQKKLSVFSQKVLSRSVFYSKYKMGKSFNGAALPLISKSEFMEHFDEINTVGISRERAMSVALEAEKTRDFKSEVNGITVGLSTGTSGKRGIFLVSESERAMWVTLVMNRVIRPRPFKKQKVAFFLRANSNLYSSVQSSLFQFRYFDIFKPLPELLNELNDYCPDILASQPSILVDICRAKLAGEIYVSPLQVISFAEVLHDNDRNLIESAFGIRITEVYQCTEGFLGVSCKYGTMHLNEDIIQVEKEWIDEECFYPIITDFSRRSQPVVKYKMNDILKVKKTPCSCGSPFLALEKIIGRDDDVLVFGGIRLYPDLIARRIALETDAFKRYAITQVSENKIEVGIECLPSDYEPVKENIETVLSLLLKERGIMHVEFHFFSGIGSVAGSKIRKIKRQFHEA